MPRQESAVYDGYFNASPECWGVFTEVLESEFSNAMLFGQVHQLTVDTYAAQHAGGNHPDKSVDVHLTGLHLVLTQGVRPTGVPQLLQRLASRVKTWPHLTPPKPIAGITVFEVALAESMEEHVNRVHEWSRAVWDGWSEHHPTIAQLISLNLD
jgi:hypothetical protein